VQEIIKCGSKEVSNGKIFIPSLIKICTAIFSLLMMFVEIIAVYSENLTKPVCTLCGRNEELVNVIAGSSGIIKGGYFLEWLSILLTPQE
jgi:hypothetical protein